MTSKLITADDQDAALFIQSRLSLNLTPNREVICEENLLVILFLLHHSILQFQDKN